MAEQSSNGDASDDSPGNPSRRFVLIGLPLFLAGCQSSERLQAGLPSFSFGGGSMYGSVSDNGHQIAAAPVYRLDRRFLRQTTAAPARYAKSPGTIVVVPSERHLYLVGRDGQATRYGVGVGREGFAWSGSATVGGKAVWPTWTPPPAMVARDPKARPWAAGMPGGINNPLGARALYLYQGGRDTLYRIHGTNEPWTIGQAVSSGCVRMMNQDIIDLYNRVSTGARVVVVA